MNAASHQVRCAVCDCATTNTGKDGAVTRTLHWLTVAALVAKVIVGYYR